MFFMAVGTWFKNVRGLDTGLNTCWVVPGTDIWKSLFFITCQKNYSHYHGAALLPPVLQTWTTLCSRWLTPCETHGHFPGSSKHDPLPLSCKQEEETWCRLLMTQARILSSCLAHQNCQLDALIEKESWHPSSTSARHGYRAPEKVNRRKGRCIRCCSHTAMLTYL